MDFPNYVDYRVIAEYSDDLKPNKDKYSEDVEKREAAELLKVVEKQQVLLRKYPDEAKQINVTVPLYVCMYAYGGNGKVVTPTEEAYAITSRSNCPVQITSVQATEAIWDLKEKAAELKEAGELYLALDGQTVTEEKTDTSKNDRWLIPAAPLITEDGDGDDGSGENREPQNLSIQIDAAIAGGNVNEEGEARVCTVTYTVAAAVNCDGRVRSAEDNRHEENEKKQGGTDRRRAFGNCFDCRSACVVFHLPAGLQRRRLF